MYLNVSLFSLLQSILNGFLMDFPHVVRQSAEAIVGAAVELYFRMSSDLLPTPAKSHYVFNLRDLSKCIQGEKFSLNILVSFISNHKMKVFVCMFI